MSVQSLTTAPINVYSKTFWTGFILAVNEEASCELGLHDKINPAAVREPIGKGWSASRFSPNILQYIFTDRSINIDASSHTVHEDHYHAAPSRPITETERKEKKKEEEEKSLNKYKYIGTSLGGLGAFLSAMTWRGYQRCHSTHELTLHVLTDLKDKILQDWTPLKPELERIVETKLKVDEIRFKILYRYFFASLGILVGGALVALGGFSKEPRFITWGGVVLAIAAIWAAASAGFHLQDKKDIRELYQVIALDPQRLADKALWGLGAYQEGMTLAPSYAAPSSPMITPSFNPFLNVSQPAFPFPRPSVGPGGYQVDARYEAAPSAPYIYE